MKSTIRSAFIATFILVAPLASCAQAPDSIRLLKHQEEGVTLLFEPDEADLALPISKEVIRRFKSKPSGDVRKQFDTLKSQRKEILSFIAAELGMEKPGEQMATVYDKFALLSGSLASSLNDSRQFRIWNRESLKSALASGEKVPGFSYSANTGEIFFNIQSTNPAVRPLAGPLPLVLRRTGANPMQQIGEQLDAYESAINQLLSAGVLCHEVAEIGISVDIGLASPFRRWLVEGAANHIAIKTLRHFLGEEAARDFASSFDSRPYDARKKQIDLVGWRAIEWDKITPSYLDNDLTQAYYNLATKAFEDHIASSGPGTVQALFKGIAASLNKSDADLYAVLKTITGKDIRKVLEAEFPASDSRLRGFAARLMKVQPLHHKANGSWEAKEEADTIIFSTNGLLGIRMFLDYGTLGQPVNLKVEFLGEGMARPDVFTHLLSSPRDAIIVNRIIDDKGLKPGQASLKVFINDEILQVRKFLLKTE